MTLTLKLLLFVSACLWQVAVQAQIPASEFTTTARDKVTIVEDSAREKESGIDHFTHLCPGLGGYQVIRQGFDLRSWINLKVNGRIVDLQSQTLNGCPGQFPAKANDVVEWRGIRRGDLFRPYAIIYRMASSAEGDKGKPLETFVIVKLDQGKSKVVAHLSAKQGNEKAESVADKLCRL